MRRKRILCLIAVILMVSICGMTSVYAANAETTTVISGGDVQAHAGDTVRFPVYIANNPGIASIKIDLTYDTTVFTLAENNTATETQAVEKGDALTTGSVVAQNTESGCRIFWWNDKNVKQDGVLFWVQLQVSSTAGAEKHGIEISYSAKDTGNEREELVPLLTKKGSITITSTESVVYGGTVRIRAGETIDYPIYIKNNPGISSVMLYVKLNSADTGIEAVAEEGNGLMAELGDFTTKGNVLANQYLSGWRIMWYTTDGDQKGDGSLFTLKLKAGAHVNAKDVQVSITCMPDNTTNAAGDKVSLRAAAKGLIKLREILYGDVDDNLKVDFADALYLKRYIAGWAAYYIVDQAAADVNHDGAIDLKDSILLEQHIAGWSGSSLN